MASIRLSRYVIIKEIGRGGMATVYLVRNPQDNQIYALKVLPRQFTHDPMFRDRFAREAKTVSQLRHPSIIPVYDYGEENGTPYMVMRYMSGGTLADRMARGRLSRQESVRILRSIAAALDYAHQKGVVHRDIKPANIFFDEQGAAYLGDFGVVQLAEATRSISGTSVIGTPAYMSPEQVKGGARIDGRSDEYALAIMLYEMLAGRPPYQAETPTQQMMMHVLEPTPRISTHIPQIEPALEQILLKALAKNPGERYANVTEFINAVDTLVAPPQPTVYGQATRRYEAPETRVQAAPLPEQPASQRSFLLFGGIAAASLCALAAVGFAAFRFLASPDSPAVTATPNVAAVVLVSPDLDQPTTAVPATLAFAAGNPLSTVTPLPPITDTPTWTPTPLPTSTRPPTQPPPTHAPPTIQMNRPPRARDDSFEVAGGSVIQTLTVPASGVLDNDDDPDNNPLTVRLQTNPSQGSVTLNPDGSFTYTPSGSSSCGDDSFVYLADDGQGGSAQAEVHLQINCVTTDPGSSSDFIVHLTNSQPSPGSTLNTSTGQIKVFWETTQNSYSGSYLFTKIELMLYQNQDCTGGTHPWGEVGYWSRVRANNGPNSQDIDVQIQPSFTAFAPGGGPIGYMAVHITIFGDDGSQSPQLGQQLAQEKAFCYPYTQ